MSSALRKTVGRPHHRGRSSRTAMSPLGAIGRGLVAGAAGLAVAVTSPPAQTPTRLGDVVTAV